MKNSVFVGMLVLIGAGLILLWRAGNGVPTIPWNIADRATPRFTTPPPAPPPAPPSAPKPALVHKAAPAAAEPTPVPPQPIQVQVRPPALTVHPPFPAANKIALGANAEAVTGTYGNPSATAVTSANGHIIETLFYAKERERSATVIRIVDGKVSAAYTKAAPFSPPGSSVRTLGLPD